MTDVGLDLLAALLADEHAAVYAYGVLGGRLDDQDRRQALADFDAHRRSRDDVTNRLRAAGRPPAGPHPSYDVTVVARTDALALAVRIETSLAVRWRDVLGATADVALRRLAVAGLQASAVRAAQWRRTAGVQPVTVALPGVAAG